MSLSAWHPQSVGTWQLPCEPVFLFNLERIEIKLSGDVIIGSCSESKLWILFYLEMKRFIYTSFHFFWSTLVETGFLNTHTYTHTEASGVTVRLVAYEEGSRRTNVLRCLCVCACVHVCVCLGAAVRKKERKWKYYSLLSSHTVERLSKSAASSNNLFVLFG